MLLPGSHKQQARSQLPTFFFFLLLDFAEPLLRAGEVCEGGPAVVGVVGVDGGL